MILRFEKAKENLYKRKYKNVNSIISEIGGFAQTLLAVGFFLCTRLSQLELDKEIINRAFNFESLAVLPSGQDDASKPQEGNQGQGNPQQQQQGGQQKSEVIKQPPPQMPKKKHPPKVKVVEFEDSQVGPRMNSPNNLQNSNLLLSSPISSSHQYLGALKNSKNMTGSIPKPAGVVTPNVGQSAATEAAPHKKMNLFELSQIIRRNTKYVDPTDQSVQKGIQEQPQQQQQSQQQPDPDEVSEGHFRRMMNKYTGSMTLNVWEYVKFFVWPFGKLKEKKQIIDYSIDKLYYHLDVLNVVKKLLEVDKLKRLLMNEDQLNLFECWPKPLIRSAEALGLQQDTVNHDQPSDILYQDVRSDVEKTQMAYSSYLHISQKPNKLPLEQKLLDLMDRNLIELFELNQNDQRDLELMPQSFDIENMKTPSNQQINYAKSERLTEYPLPSLNTDTQRNMLNTNTDRVNVYSQPHCISEEEIMSIEKESLERDHIEIAIEEDRNAVKIKTIPNQFWK